MTLEGLCMRVTRGFKICSLICCLSWSLPGLAEAAATAQEITSELAQLESQLDEQRNAYSALLDARAMVVRSGEINLRPVPGADRACVQQPKSDLEKWSDYLVNVFGLPGRLIARSTEAVVRLYASRLMELSRQECISPESAANRLYEELRAANENAITEIDRNVVTVKADIESSRRKLSTLVHQEIPRVQGVPDTSRMALSQRAYQMWGWFSARDFGRLEP